MVTVGLGFAAVGLRACGPISNFGTTWDTGTECELVTEDVEAEVDKRRLFSPPISAGVLGRNRSAVILSGTLGATRSTLAVPDKAVDREAELKVDKRLGAASGDAA